MPQGTLAEKLRSAGAGIPGFYTATGVGTCLERGGLAIKYAEDGHTIDIYSTPRDSRWLKGKRYLFEDSIDGDFAFVRAWKADEMGNVKFHKSARNFNRDVGPAAKICIVEAE